MSGLSFSLGSKRPAQPGAKAPPKKPINVKDLFGAEDEEEEHGVKKQRPDASGLFPYRS